MKIVINVCYGGFSLSWEAVKRLAELNNREFYLFESEGFSKEREYTPVSENYDKNSWTLTAFDIPNPNEVIGVWPDNGTIEEKRAHNALYNSHSFDVCPTDRTDPLLIQVVEELGDKANGSCAELKVIEIPDDVDYEIEEYNGQEWVAEKHRTWSY
ncbi:MAG TPA: hypothetical protein VKR58_06265 [Aquella sp.]|nr:hypothetical protein [Aquella sp.]